MKCLMCGKEVERRKFHFHLIKEHNKMKMKDYFIEYGFFFTKKEVLEKMYFLEKKSLKQITAEAENTYGMSNLKPFILEFFKELGLKKRNVSDANKNYFEKNDVWNKGLKKESDIRVLEYSKKKKELYEKVHKKINSFSIDELLKYKVQIYGNKKLRKILRKKLSERQRNICPICERKFDFNKKGSIHIHHIDRDNSNYKKENLIVLCQSCHVKISKHKYRLSSINFIKTYDEFIDNIELIRNSINSIVKNKQRDISYRDREYKECVLCGEKEKMHAHHLDGNLKNNDEENLIFLCASCHGKITGYNIKEKNKNDMINRLIEKEKNKFNHEEYSEKEKKASRCSINISKLKLKEFVQ